jgi:hypothetical protein
MKALIVEDEIKNGDYLRKGVENGFVSTWQAMDRMACLA